MSRPSVGLVLSQAADGSGSNKRLKLSLFDSQPTRPRPLIPLHDDGSSSGNSAAGSTSSAAAVLADRAARGEVDPLDAFMAAMGAAAAAPTAPALPTVQRPSDAVQDQEQQRAAAADESSSGEEDPLDAFMKTLAPAAAMSQPASSQPGKATRYDDHGEELTTGDDDDTEDLYALLGRRDDEDEDDDEQQQSASLSSEDGDADDGDGDGVVKRGKHIAALPPLDHSTIAYPPLPAPSYTPHPSLVPPLSPSVLAQLTAFATITTTPPHVTPPVPSFSLLPLPPALLSFLSSQSFTSPTPIQAQAVPLALLGRDLICQAATGSGKTLAFLLPLFQHLAAREPVSEGRRGKGGAGEGPMALVVAPTRELGEQIFVVARRMSRLWGWRVAAVLGGSNKHEQYKQMLRGLDIVVATPGRLLDLLTMAACSLFRCSFLVLDEADRMLSLGFDRQVRSIVGQLRPDRQTLLFSATMPARVERLCTAVVRGDAVRVVVGIGGVVSHHVRQEVVIVQDEAAKLSWLRLHLPSLLQLSPVLIFTNTKASADALAASLASKASSSPLSAASLHGDQHQHQRLETMRRFRSGSLPVLVATDVAARGLDVQALRVVVVYAVGRDKDGHVHRVGRVGRAGEEGRAVTLLMQQDGGKGGRLVLESMKEAGEQPPAELLQLVEQDTDREDRDIAGGRGGGRRGGRGGGRGGRGHGDRGRGGYVSHSAVPAPPSVATPASTSSAANVTSAPTGAAASPAVHPSRMQQMGITVPPPPPVRAAAAPIPAAAAAAAAASATSARRSRWDR